MPTNHRRRLVIAIVSAGVALLVLVVIGVYGLLSRGQDQAPSAQTSPQAPVTPTSPVQADGPQPIPETNDPELFARNVAAALFNWDTRADANVMDWAQELVDVANVDEAMGLAADVRGYLPDPATWKQLRGYGTKQWLTVDSVVVPDLWATALEQATPEQLPPGSAAFTIAGTRHRAGTWDAEAVQTEHDVAFTVILACAEDNPCELLRLSRLDHPLD